MWANVSRDYASFYAEQTGELVHDYAIFDEPFEVIRKVNNHASGYRMRDCDDFIHPFVPAEFVTIIKE